MYLTLVSLFFMGMTRKSKEKGINNHLTTVASITKWHLYSSAYQKCNVKNWTSLGISFLSFICPCMFCLKENMQRKTKAKRIKMLYIWLQACLLGDVGVIGCTSKVIVPIKQLWLCVSVCDFLISQIVITCKHLCNLVMFFTHNMQYSLLLLIHV